MPKITNLNVFMKGKPPKSSKGFYHLYSPILYISNKVSNLMIHKIKPEVLQDFQFMYPRDQEIGIMADRRDSERLRGFCDGWTD